MTGIKGGNDRHVIVEGDVDNLHWVGGTGLVERINRSPQTLAAELEGRITDQERAAWVKGSIEDWVLEGHRLAQTVAYGDLGTENPAPIAAVTRKRQNLFAIREGWGEVTYLLDAALKGSA